MPLKNARIHLRVTDEEKQSLVEKATLARQSVSQYILSLSENKTIIVEERIMTITKAWKPEVPIGQLSVTKRKTVTRQVSLSGTGSM